MPAQPSPSPQRTDKRRQPPGDKSARAAAPRASRELDSEQIARRAYERFEARGGEHGRDQEDWFNAEQELKGTRGE
jgi:Protein of unknown function (DUF2934)